MSIEKGEQGGDSGHVHLSADRLLELTSDYKELANVETQAVIMLKPEALDKMIGRTSFKEVLIGLLDSMDIEVISDTPMRLNEQQIHDIYPILDEPSEYGDIWKSQVVSHLSDNPVEILVVRGKGLQYKLQNWKYHLRQRLSEPEQNGFVLKNMLHVSDEGEYGRIHDSLFGPE
ncbi:MAG: hypothetical protein EKK63_06945 [Acinetobacter sp.]|uniref:hypothetical protein n=1 Tax=Acinetobacter sp. TaxID=472 RepID=UPI000F941DC1|nr:hypothetical protein [Acinetobacter sp.]RUP40650.1 MAG: hypothetical protein EKK63_06945 [Acinetobacter sp.]